LRALRRAGNTPLGALAARDGAAARQARALEAKIRALEDV
jgi:hypothetical protein